MGSVTIKDLLGIFNVRDFGFVANPTADNAPAINAAIAAATAVGGGEVWLPPDAGTVGVGSTIRIYDNIELVIPVGVTLKLLPNSNCDVIANADPVGGNSRVRITGAGVIDGNRANQGAGNWHGIHFVNVTDAQVAGITVQSCQGCGVLLSGCTMLDIDVFATDNGLDGVDLLDTVRGVIRPRAYDNCRVAAAGDADGIHLEGASTDNVIIGAVCYDSASSGKRQGYGVREAAGSSCDWNLIVGGSLAGNAFGDISLVGPSSRRIDNATVLATAGTPSTQAFGDLPELGSAVTAAPLDHKHGMPVGELWQHAQSSTTPDGSTTQFNIGSGVASKKVRVFVNGLLRRPTTDYSFTAGNSYVMFAWAPASGDDVRMDYVEV